MKTQKSLRTIKFVLPAVAILLSLVAFYAFKPAHNQKTTTNAYFVYQLSNEPSTDDDYESDANWQYSNAAPSPCETAGDATCFITIDQEILDEYPGSTEEEQLSNYLLAQDGTPGTFSSAIAAVNSLRGSNTKVAN
ncbi:MAG: hypothetical protein QM594_20705 [Niabella sp.]